MESCESLDMLSPGLSQQKPVSATSRLQTRCQSRALLYLPLPPVPPLSPCSPVHLNLYSLLISPSFCLSALFCLSLLLCHPCLLLSLLCQFRFRSHYSPFFVLHFFFCFLVSLALLLTTLASCYHLLFFSAVSFPIQRTPPTVCPSLLRSTSTQHSHL